MIAEMAQHQPASVAQMIPVQLEQQTSLQVVVVVETSPSLDRNCTHLTVQTTTLIIIIMRTYSAPSYSSLNRTMEHYYYYYYYYYYMV